jgi:hypothetical protein
MRHRVQETLAFFLVVLLAVGAILGAAVRVLVSGFYDPGWVSFAVDVALAIATLILMWQSVEISRRQLTSQRRPILIPQSPPWHPHLSPWDPHAPSGLAEMVESPTWLARISDVQLWLYNVGSGTALSICGVLILQPYDPKTLPKQFSVFERLPIAPGDSREIALREGGSLFSGEERIGGIPLGVLQEEGIARLTLTWRDEAGLKHAAVFDLDLTGRWLPIGFQHEIPEDLWDMEKEKRVYG